MILLRAGPENEECPAILDDFGLMRNVGSIIEDYNHSFFECELINELKGINISDLPVISDETRIGPCISGTSKIICVGLNYVSHAAEAGSAAPEAPVLFLKAPSAISGPFDDLAIPEEAMKVDWEVEIGVIIGKRGKMIDKEKARSHIMGFCVFNDVSERSWQLQSTGQWTKGKSYDGFAPIGPWLVTPEEVPSIGESRLWLNVNGKSMQNGNSRDMIFSIENLICYISKYMTLEPGDIIATGTPAGVGLGMSPETFLKQGDVMTLGVDGLGKQRIKIVRG